MPLRRASPDERPFPTWALVLVGALAASAWRPRPSAGPPTATAPPRDVQEVLERGSARELRGLPGIGERRALDLVEARWRHGPDDPPLYLHALPGFGPASEAGLRASGEAVSSGTEGSP